MRAGCLILFVVALGCFAFPALAEGPAQVTVTGATNPAVAYIGVYVVDFKQFNVAEGTFETNFYLNIRSGTNLSINDLEFINGHVTSLDLIKDTAQEKNYRVYAVMTTDPDLRNFPFDNHTLPIIIEPKILNENQLVIQIDQNQTGISNEANNPGWSFSGTNQSVMDKSYGPDEIPYSRVIFGYGIIRDTTSTFLKFFLPIGLIVIVSLASLLMKVSSRLGLNASMFLAAVLIHWRISDAIPLVAYATFLDLFMIITYATLVMVLISGILILRYNEAHNVRRVEQINHWSIRIIPPVTLILYCLLFISLWA